MAINLSFNKILTIKNPTPRQIAFYASLWSTGIAGLILCLSAQWFVPEGMANYYWLFFIIVLFFISAYTIFLLLLKKYIYRKVKLIYKTIHQKKLSSQEKKDVVDVDMNIIEEVEKQVEEWAEEKEQEVARYKEWAEYRRRFVGDISHELKTPIFNIQGYLDSVLEGGYQDEKVFIPFLNKASKNVERLHTIVEDLESIAKLESGELLYIQRFDIRRLTQQVFEELEMKATRRNMELSFKDGADAPFMVQADEEKVRQVMINLVHNSIKYGKEDGRTKVGFYEMGPNILIEVADNGIGIPEQHINHVFDRFYRVDKHRSRIAGGSGLGLSIVKHILEGHQQTINVRSTEGMGSTFGFTLEKAS